MSKISELYLSFICRFKPEGIFLLSVLYVQKVEKGFMMQVQVMMSVINDFEHDTLLFRPNQLNQLDALLLFGQLQ